MAARRACVLALVASTALAGCTSVIDRISQQPSNDWALAMTGVLALHERGITGAGVVVAVVDTGVDAAHPEFEGVTIRWGDVVNGRTRPYDDGGHGTHVSGLVVGQGRGRANDPQLMGIAPGATLLHVKGVPGSGTGNGPEVAEAIDRATSNGAHVIVLSLGGEPGFLILGREVEDAVERAIDGGIVVVAAAGNADTDSGETGADCTLASPASLPRVIAVGAVDRTGTIASFSCKGDNSGGPLGLIMPVTDPDRKPELVAPGVDLIGPWPRRNCGGAVAEYCVLSGTSQAAPIVGGIVALLLEEHPELKRKGPAEVERIKQALVRSADKLADKTGHDDRYGYGLVRADLALAKL